MDIALMTAIFEDLRKASVGFRPPDSMDWDSYAGMEEESLITYGERFAFILSPSGQICVVDGEAGKEYVFESQDVLE